MIVKQKKALITVLLLVALLFKLCSLISVTVINRGNCILFVLSIIFIIVNVFIQRNVYLIQLAIIIEIILELDGFIFLDTFGKITNSIQIIIFILFFVNFCLRNKYKKVVSYLVITGIVGNFISIGIFTLQYIQYLTIIKSVNCAYISLCSIYISLLILIHNLEFVDKREQKLVANIKNYGAKEQLQKLKEMVEAGEISQATYELKKDEILRQL